MSSQDPFKVCGCGTTYTEEEWDTLHFIGLQETKDETHVFILELRNCIKCHSTIGIETKKSH
jgi:hypothetical protein